MTIRLCAICLQQICVLIWLIARCLLTWVNVSLGLNPRLDY